VMKNDGKIDLPAAVLVQLAKEDDAAAFAYVYRAYKHQVFALCVRMTNDPFASEDLTQDIFLQVYRKMSSFRGEAAFSTWLYSVARNVVLMHLRRRSIQTVPGDVSEFEIEPTGVSLACHSKTSIEPLRCLALKRAISTLPTHRRNVLILHDIEGFSHREVGARLGIETGTSKSQLHHAHVTLRGEAWDSLH
jgi:RNA polymerase sigma-70 factor (ECF subfamily)